jgi:hypothetical protein
VEETLHSFLLILDKEHVMKSRTLILASMALFVSGASSAISGPCTTEIDGLTKTLAAKDAGSGPTSGAAGRTQEPAGSSAQHPPTAVMRQETQGKATSPEDVRRQNQGQPTVAQQTPGTAVGTDKMDEAAKALARARALDAQGKEAECIDAVRQGKELTGPN